MNAMIQCFLACNEVIKVIKSEKFHEMLNIKNPLGYQGKVANSFR